MNDTPKLNEAAEGGSSPVPCSPSFMEYQPESWSMLKDSIYAARDALRSGMEYAEELLAEKDRTLGRTHKSNRESAEMMEIEIEKMKSAFDGLKKPNGCAYGENAELRAIIYQVSTGGYTPMQAHEWLKSHPENAGSDARRADARNQQGG